VEFRDEIPLQTTARERATNVLDRMTAENQTTHDILDFLRRPQVLLSFEWNESQAFNDNIHNIDCFVDLVKTHNVYNKILGFRYFKADFVLTVQVNAQPLQQGGLLVVSTSECHRPTIFTKGTYNCKDWLS